MDNLTFRAKALLRVIVDFVRSEGRPPLQRELSAQSGDANEGVRGDVGLVSDWYIETGAVNRHPFGVAGARGLDVAVKELADAGLIVPRVKRYRGAGDGKAEAYKRVEKLRRKVNLSADEQQELDLLQKGLQDNAGSPYLPTEAGFKYADEQLEGNWETW